MADTVSTEQDLGVSISPAQKRKRGADSTSPESRRSKRGAGAVPMNHAIDAAAQAFMDAANDASQLASNMSSADFSALQQAAAGDHADASDPANASSTAAAALGTMYPTIHVPQSTEETFAAQAAAENEHDESAFNEADVVHSDGLGLDSTAGGIAPTNGIRPEPRFQAATTKPAVGSEEWHKMRKDNHKEVERRRRETINEGINELAKIVPGCEKNKGSILQRAVAFISQLKENETQNIEKWTLEKLLTEQAISELSASNDKLKGMADRSMREMEMWKRLAIEAGVSASHKEEPPTAS